MNREELIAEVKRKRLVAQVKAKRAQAQAPPETPAPKQSGLDKARGAIQAFNRGTMWGAQDEIVGAGRALIDPLLDNAETRVARHQAARERSLAGLPAAQPDQSFGDAYEMYRDDERATLDQFTEENPVTSFGLTMGGGFASPFNKALPGFGLAGAPTAQQIGRAGVEGAVAGFAEGEGDLTSRLGSAVTGAGVGAGVGAGFKGVGGLLNKTLLRRNVAPDLVQPDGRFKPLNLAAPDTLPGKLYRTMGRIPGVHGVMTDQQEPFLREAAEKLAKVNKDVADRRLHIGIDADIAAARLKEAARGAKKATRRGLHAATDTIERGKQRGQLSIALDFQQQAARHSLPEHAIADGALDGVDTRDARKTRRVIADWWNSKGFEEVKAKTFPWGNRGDRGLNQAIREALADDPGMALSVNDAVAKIRKSTKTLRGVGLGAKARTGEEIEDILDANIEAIDGNALMEIRNTFAKAANAKNSGEMRQIAKKIDDFIRGNMDNVDDIARFNDQIERYTTGLTFQQAARDSRTFDNNWVINPDVWYANAKNFGGRNMSLKNPPMDTTAKQAHDMMKRTTARLGQKGTKISRAGSELAEDRNARLTRELDAVNAEARIKRAAIDMESQPGGPQYAAKQRAAELNKQAVHDDYSPLSMMLSADVAASMVPGVAKNVKSRGLRTLIGSAVGNLAASESTQKFVAGQTGWQEAARAALLRGDMAQYNAIISRLSAQFGTGAD